MRRDQRRVRPWAVSATRSPPSRAKRAIQPTPSSVASARPVSSCVIPGWIDETSRKGRSGSDAIGVGGAGCDALSSWGTPQPDSGRFAAMPGDKKDIARVFESFRDEKRHELIAETAAQYVPLSVGGHGHTTPTGGLNRTHRTLPMAAKMDKVVTRRAGRQLYRLDTPHGAIAGEGVGVEYAQIRTENTNRYAQKNVRPFGADGYPGAGRGCPPKRGITRMFRGAISRPRVPDQGRHGPGAGKPDSDGAWSFLRGKKGRYGVAPARCCYVR